MSVLVVSCGLSVVGRGMAVLVRSVCVRPRGGRQARQRVDSAAHAWPRRRVDPGPTAAAVRWRPTGRTARSAAQTGRRRRRPFRLKGEGESTNMSLGGKNARTYLRLRHSDARARVFQ